jgi:2-amino-4-hydroxy-6-hydroxymethyldihydropteridine diphosphokinase
LSLSFRMHTAYLLLGSNLGDTRHNLRDALARLGNHGVIRTESLVYRSAAWGNTSMPDFLNMTVEFHTSLLPDSLLSTALNIETAMGRTRSGKWEARLIDIDILFYDNLVVNSPGLIIPHPEIQNRRFTLVPLSEIAADLIHPVSKRTIRELLQSCPDVLAVKQEGNLNEL